MTALVKDHISVSLLQARHVREKHCFTCDEILQGARTPDEDIYAISVYMPHQPTFYFHDDSCFDQFLLGLNTFDSVREEMRKSPTELLN